MCLFEIHSDEGGKPLVEVGVHILGNTLEVLGSTRKSVEVLGSTWKYSEVRGSTDIKQLLFNFIWSD